MDEHPLVVCEGPEEDVEDIASDLIRDGWQIIRSFDVPGGVPPNAKIACVGTVNDAKDASAAVLAAVWGAGVVVSARADRGVIDQLCEDLRKIGTLDHHTGPRPRSPLDTEQRTLLAHLLDGKTLGDAAKQLHMSRRTADRRLAAARDALGVTTTTEALMEARRRGLI